MALMPVAEALQRVLESAAPLPPEPAPLAEATGRVLAADVAALRTQPPGDVSAMDGYAVRAADVSETPTQLTVIGEVAAGHPFSGAIGIGQAARIFTGGLMPPGADTVVIQELVTCDGDTITIGKPTAKGKNVRLRGLDFNEGDVLLSKGRLLTGRDVMLAAAMNHPTLHVHRRPRVAVLATGDELVPPGSKPGPGEIVYSNGFALMSIARGEGAEVIDLGIARDRLDDITGAVRRARDAQADVLLTSGGASVGEHDLVQKALAIEGLQLSFWRVALRPGRPMLNGRLGGMHVLGVPGNPVSAYVCAFLFLVPLIRRLAGRADLEPAHESARLGRDLPANDERADYLRASLEKSGDGSLIATPLSAQDSSMMGNLARADCLVVREPYAPAANTGSPCVIVKLAL